MRSDADLFSSADRVAIVASDSINTVGEVELATRARRQLWLDASAGQIGLIFIMLGTVPGTGRALYGECQAVGDNGEQEQDQHDEFYSSDLKTRRCQNIGVCEAPDYD